MEVFPLAATMGDRMGPNWARPGWWRGRVSHSRRPAPLFSTTSLTQSISTPAAARRMHLALRRFVGYIQRIRLPRTPMGGPRQGARLVASTIERGPPGAGA